MTSVRQSGYPPVPQYIPTLSPDSIPQGCSTKQPPPSLVKLLEVERVSPIVVQPQHLSSHFQPQHPSLHFQPQHSSHFQPRQPAGNDILSPAYTESPASASRQSLASELERGCFSRPWLNTRSSVRSLCSHLEEGRLSCRWLPPTQETEGFALPPRTSLTSPASASLAEADLLSPVHALSTSEIEPARPFPAHTTRKAQSPCVRLEEGRLSCRWLPPTQESEGFLVSHTPQKHSSAVPASQAPQLPPTQEANASPSHTPKHSPCAQLEEGRLSCRWVPPTQESEGFFAVHPSLPSTALAPRGSENQCHRGEESPLFSPLPFVAPEGDSSNILTTQPPFAAKPRSPCVRLEEGRLSDRWLPPTQESEGFHPVAHTPPQPSPVAHFETDSLSSHALAQHKPGVISAPAPRPVLFPVVDLSLEHHTQPAPEERRGVAPLISHAYFPLTLNPVHHSTVGLDEHKSADPILGHLMQQVSAPTRSPTVGSMRPPPTAPMGLPATVRPRVPAPMRSPPTAPMRSATTPMRPPSHPLTRLQSASMSKPPPPRRNSPGRRTKEALEAGLSSFSAPSVSACVSAPSSPSHVYISSSDPSLPPLPSREPPTPPMLVEPAAPSTTLISLGSSAATFLDDTTSQISSRPGANDVDDVYSGWHFVGERDNSRSTPDPSSTVLSSQPSTSSFQFVSAREASSYKEELQQVVEKDTARQSETCSPSAKSPLPRTSGATAESRSVDIRVTERSALTSMASWVEAKHDSEAKN